MKLINLLPEFLYSGSELSVWGSVICAALWLIGFVFLGVGMGMFVYRRFRYAVSKLERDNAKNSERLRVYESAIGKQFRIHDSAT